MHFKLHLLLMIFTLALSSVDLQAQTVDVIYLVRENTIYAWSPDAEIRQIGEPIPGLSSVRLSPTGDHFLYTILREEVTLLLEAECPCGGPIPTGAEFWLMDAETGERTLIVGQPEIITDLGDVFYYDQAVWSPDGQHIAWVVSDLYIYDLATGLTTLTQEYIPSTALVSNIAGIKRWTPTGIWFEFVRYDDSHRPIYEGYHIYQPTGGMVAEIPAYAQLASLPQVDTQRPSTYRYWNGYSVDDNGVDSFVTHSLTGWQTFNLVTGETSPLNQGIIVQVASASPETSLRFYPTILTDDGGYIWEVYNAEGEILPVLRDEGTALSRDGSFLFTPVGAGIFTVINNQGEKTNVELPWSYDYSVAGHTKTLLERDTTHLWVSSHCSDSELPPRFRSVNPLVDDPLVAHVLGTTANNLRSEPGMAGENTGSIPGGSSIEILEGPVCADGLVWWYVEGMDEQRGWTAEGANNKYWLAPGCSVDYCESEG